MRLVTLLATAVLMCTGVPAMALEPFSAEYQVRYKGVPASATSSLSKLERGRWMYRMDISNIAAKLNQATVFDEHAGKLRPLGGADHTNYLAYSGAVTTRYDWTNRQVRWTGDVKPHRAGPVALQSGDMDALLINLALIRDASAGQRRMGYRLLENGRAKSLHYTASGEESVTLAGRPVKTTRFVQGDGNKRTVVWVSPQVPTPVRITQYEDGKEVFNLQLKNWRG